MRATLVLGQPAALFSREGPNAGGRGPYRAPGGGLRFVGLGFGLE